MAREIICNQGDDTWLASRIGKFTASEFHIFLGSSDTRYEMLCEKASEIFTGDTDEEPFENRATIRGHLLEEEARRLYQVINNIPVRTVGFFEDDGEFDGLVGSSPDGLIGEDGILEIKCPKAKAFSVAKMKKKQGKAWIKPEYKTQVNFNLMVTGRQWADLFYYHPRLGYIVERIGRDETEVEKIKEALRRCRLDIIDILEELGK